MKLNKTENGKYCIQKLIDLFHEVPKQNTVAKAKYDFRNEIKQTGLCGRENDNYFKKLY